MAMVSWGIEVMQVPSGLFTLLAENSDTTYHHIGLPPKVTRFYKIIAVNAVGQSILSHSVEGNTSSKDNRISTPP
jgi:hypothetical protein